MTDAALQDGFHFAGYTLDTRLRELRDPAGAVVPMRGKAFDVLCYLIAHRDRIVGKDELLAHVWEGRVVEENNLSQAIATLRRALGGSVGGQRYVITVQGRGYRFIADVGADADPATDDDAVAVAPMASDDRPPLMPPRRWWPVAVVALAILVLAAGGAWWRWTQVTPMHAPSMAVLPFRSLSATPADELMQLGMADTLISRLGRSTRLVVRPLDATRRFGNSRLAPAAIARALDVDYLIDGSMQRSGDLVRVNTRLLDAATGRTLWSGTFDATTARVFLLQDRIADAVTQRLSLPRAQTSPVARSPCEGADVVAYRAYLSGRYLNNRPDSARLLDAVRDFQRAIDRDPSCARAYAGLAFAYRGLVMTGDRRPRDLFPLAKAAVAQALAIDPALAEAHASRGFIEFWYDWDWPAAEASLQHAIRLDPSLPEAHLAYAHLLGNLGRSRQAAQEARLALEADPLSPLINTLAAGFFDGAGQHAEAKAQTARALELAPDFWVALLSRGGAAMGRGDVAQGLTDLRRARALSHDNSQALTVLAMAELRAGHRAAAEQILATMQARAAAGYVPSTSLAAVQLALGRNDIAMTLLERAFDERDVRLSFVRIDRRFDALRGTPRFIALLKRMHLDDSTPDR